MAWLRNNTLDLVDVVTLHLAQLVLERVTCCGRWALAGKQSRYDASHKVDSAFYVLWNGKMSISLWAE